MIAITAEFKGSRYLLHIGLANYPDAEKEALRWKREYPAASIFIADRQAHIERTQSITAFKRAYLGDCSQGALGHSIG